MSDVEATKIQGGDTTTIDISVRTEIRRRPALLQCDVIVFHGGAFVSRAIRALTRSRGEAKSWANHVGFVVLYGGFYSATVQEAVGSVVRRTLSAYLGKATTVRIYRAITLNSVESAEILRSAETTVGRRYGYGKIALHALDAAVSRVFRRDVKLFRRFAFSKQPICSWDLAHHWQAAGKSFGVAVDVATPDDIDDFCKRRSDHYELIFEGEI